MENAVLVGLSRQMALSRELDVVANNIANINTTGFKSDRAMFEEYLSSSAREDDVPGNGRVSFVQDRGTWHNMGQGAIEATGNPLDIAIDGAGMLAVQTQRGERYTRNGSMHINASGQLVTADGMPILGENGPITFQPLDRDIAISADGRITVKEGANSTAESFRGKLRVVSFTDPQRLQKDGSSTFVAPNGVTSQPATNVKITQGAVEKSNVSGVLEMTRMIDVSRAYTQISTLLAQTSDVRKSAIQQLADVPN